MRSSLLSVFVIFCGLTVLWWSTDGLRALTAEGARRLAVARDQPKVPKATLTTMSGTSAELDQPASRVTVAEFIYTSCPTICRAAGANLARVRDEVVRRGLANDVRIYSISFDLEVDGVAELKAYGDRHDADGAIWTVARPEAEQLSQLLKSFGVVVIPDEFGGYEHNAAMYLIDKDARLTAIVDIDDIEGAVAAIEENLMQ